MDVALLFAMVVGFLLIGVPIAVSLGMASMLFLLAFSDASLASIAQSMYQAMAGHYTLLAEAIEPVAGVNRVNVEITWDPPWGMDMMSDEARLELGFM